MHTWTHHVKHLYSFGTSPVNPLLMHKIQCGWSNDSIADQGCCYLRGCWVSKLLSTGTIMLTTHPPITGHNFTKFAILPVELIFSQHLPLIQWCWVEFHPVSLSEGRALGCLPLPSSRCEMTCWQVYTSHGSPNICKDICEVNFNILF